MNYKIIPPPRIPIYLIDFIIMIEQWKNISYNGRMLAEKDD